MISYRACQVSGGELITITARDWPDASVVGAAAPRCRFGSMHAVPATVITAVDGHAGRRGEVKLVCTSPNFHRAQHHAAGSVWLTCSPNGLDFFSGTVEGTRTVEHGSLYFRYAPPQSYTQLLLAFVVALSCFFMLRAFAWCPSPSPHPPTHPPTCTPAHPRRVNRVRNPYPPTSLLTPTLTMP